MKLESILFRAALAAVPATVVGLAFSALALALFAGAASLWVLLIVTGDYARRPAGPGPRATVPRRGATLPLAA